MKQHAKNIFRVIGLALDACHNTIATDVLGLHKSDEQHWRIDNSKEIAMLDKLEEHFNNGICPLCGHCNSHRENKHSSVR